MQFIINHAEQLTIIFAICAGLFAFIKWLDARNQQLKNRRYECYMQHIRLISGLKNKDGLQTGPTEQIASAWLLLGYPEYFDITLKIFDNPDTLNIFNDNWKKIVLPQIKEVIGEIKSN